jgi:hypothetical protein
MTGLFDFLDFHFTDLIGFLASENDSF